VGQLEEQMRTLTGQIEGLQFQMTQMQTLIQNMQADTDARFSALGVGAPGKTEAAPQSGGATPPAETPQSGLTPPSGDTGGAIDLTAPDAGGGSQGVDPGGSNANPNSGALTLGAPERPLGTLSSDDLGSGLGQPLDGEQQPAPLVTDADADAQYRAGYDAVVKGDYAFAEDQFRQFIALFPDHPQAAEATNWLGEALIQRGEYDDAADILLSGYQKYPDSPRAPDMLLKLGIALVGADEHDTACRTFAEVLRRYPQQPPAFNQRVQAEINKAQC
jgi:tol-pal system protein YbgF